MRERILTHLAALVGFDTRNPPRRIDTGGIFDYLRASLPGFEFQLENHGAGAVSLLAQRGQTPRVFNVHLDTVPDSPGWSGDPHELRVEGERAIGLGACDTKGAAACLLAAAELSDGPLALLFSSDEEANDARCIAGFLRQDRGFDQAIVAEPTQAQAVLAHRGISSARIAFRGRAGHASAADALQHSAVHQALRWGTRALAEVEAQAHVRFGGLTGLRFNIGRIEGGIKGNIVAPSCEALFNFRPLPSQDIDELHANFRACAEATALEAYEERFRGPGLPAGSIAQAEERRLAARDLADELGLTIGYAVDFWTEAALFSAAGYTALVYGPGDIAQAHSADEWVALSQLDEVAANYLRIIGSARHG